MRSILWATGCLLGAVACSHGPRVAPPRPTYLYLATPIDTVWRRLLEIYTDFGFPIENIDRDSWFVRSGEMRLAPPLGQGLADCGGNISGDFAETRTILARLTTLLQSSGDSTGVRNVVHYRDRELRSECISRGTLERRLVEMIRAGRLLPIDTGETRRGDAARGGGKLAPAITRSGRPS